MTLSLYQVANRIRSMQEGNNPDKRHSCFVPNQPEFVSELIGTWKCGTKVQYHSDDKIVRRAGRFTQGLMQKSPRLSRNILLNIWYLEKREKTKFLVAVGPSECFSTLSLCCFVVFQCGPQFSQKPLQLTHRGRPYLNHTDYQYQITKRSVQAIIE